MITPSLGCSGGGATITGSSRSEEGGADVAGTPAEGYWFGSAEKASAPASPSMGELHNEILEEAMTHAAASKAELTVADLKYELERAVRIVGGASIPPDADVAAVIEDAVDWYCAECNNLTDLSELTDPYQRE